jgi:hypothetical protein
MSPKSVKLPEVQIPRIIRLKYEPFLRHFKGFEKIPAVRAIFGARTEEALRKLKVEFFSSRWGFMGVSDEDGHLLVSTHYLRTGNRRDIYLDVVHELVHVRQFRDGKELFADGFEYPDLPTEIEAYRTCVAEGRRLGLNDRELFGYLKVEWMSDRDVRRLARHVGVKPPPKRASSRRQKTR